MTNPELRNGQTVEAAGWAAWEVRRLIEGGYDLNRAIVGYQDILDSDQQQVIYPGEVIDAVNTRGATELKIMFLKRYLEGKRDKDLWYVDGLGLFDGSGNEPLEQPDWDKVAAEPSLPDVIDPSDKTELQLALAAASAIEQDKPYWLLDEQIRVSLLRDHEQSPVFKVERTSTGKTVRVSWDADGRLTVNGEYVELDERVWDLTDEIGDKYPRFLAGETITFEELEG